MDYLELNPVVAPAAATVPNVVVLLWKVNMSPVYGMWSLFWGMYSVSALSEKRVINSLLVLQGTTKCIQSVAPGLGQLSHLLSKYSLKRSGPSRHSTEQHASLQDP